MQKDVARLLLPEEDVLSELDVGSKIANEHDSSAMALRKSTEKVFDASQLNRDNVLEVKKRDLSKEEEGQIKKLEFEMVKLMSKLQEEVDEKKPFAQQIMDRINPTIKQRYIKRILSPKKSGEGKKKHEIV
jgi:gas vesicle protein